MTKRYHLLIKAGPAWTEDYARGHVSAKLGQDVTIGKVGMIRLPSGPLVGVVVDMDPEAYARMAQWYGEDDYNPPYPVGALMLFSERPRPDDGGGLEERHGKDGNSGHG